MSMRELPARFWTEAALGLVSAALLALTLAVPDWIELLFGLAPDAGDGSAEWGLALTLAVLTVICFGSAGWTVRRQAKAAAASRVAGDHLL
jgi:hypothetical protein